MRCLRIVIVAAMCLCAAQVAAAGPAEEALAVLDKWTAAFAAGDVDTIVSLYAPDALFIGTGSKVVLTKPAEIRAAFEDALLSRRLRTAPITSKETMVLSEDAVLVAALNEATGVLDGWPFSNPGRITFVVAKRGAEWKIVHMHRSVMPR